MPERARAVVLASTGTGDIIPNATVTVRQSGTTTNITETIYVNDDPDTSQYTNGAFFTNAAGLITFYLTKQKRVDVLFTKTGYTSVTIPVDVQNSALGVAVYDEGVLKGTSAEFDFIGSSVSAVVASGRTTVTITGVTTRDIATKTAAYTLLTTDDVILANASGAAFTLTLPTAVGNSGTYFDIKKIDSSVNVVTIDGNAAETIDGSATISLVQQNQSVTLFSDNANWRII